MKKLNQYLLEKLKIDKDVEPEPERKFDSVYDRMLFMLHFTESYKASDKIKWWIDKYKIHTVEGYVKNDTAFKEFTCDFTSDYRKEVSRFYDQNTNIYKRINDKLEKDGVIIYESKNSNGFSIYLKFYEKYLGFKPLFSKDMLVFEGNPYGDLG